MNPEKIIDITGEDHNGIAESIATRENFYTASMKHPPSHRWRCYETGERGTIIRERVGADIYVTFLPDIPSPEETNLRGSKKGSRSSQGFDLSPYGDISHILRN